MMQREGSETYRKPQRNINFPKPNCFSMTLLSVAAANLVCVCECVLDGHC